MKKVLSIFVCIVMLLSLIPTTAFAAENYGDLAYSYLEYINENHAQRTSGSDKELAMAQQISEQLTSFGYTPEIQNFSYSKRGTTYNSQNVVAVKPGNSTKQIIVGAHYDSVGTKGVDDNGSGTVVTLETAKRIFNQETPYTIVFVFFGAEETGLKGSGAYANAMTAEDIANTVCMINLDSILAGTYRYVYSGTVNSEDEMTLSWPFYQAMAISETLGLDMHSNDTDLNYDYPSPSTGSWSDHQSFRNLDIPYLYFEAANWELPDYEGYPQYGSSGAFETETGEVMHVPGRDDLTFIETEWGTRGKDTVTAYCQLLENLLYNLKPYTLESILGDDDEVITDLETVTVTISGPEAEKITFYDENGVEVEAETTYEDGKYVSTFKAFEKGAHALDVFFYNGGKWTSDVEWVDTEVDVTFSVLEAPKFIGAEDGKLYSKAKTVNVEDDNLANVTVNGEESGATFTVSDEGTYEIVATDADGNVTTICFEIKSIASIDSTLDGITEENVKSSDAEKIEEAIENAEKLLDDEDLTDDEKVFIKKITDKAKALIEKVIAAHTAVSTENIDKAIEITKEDVTLNDKEVLTKAKAELEKALSDFEGNYTENEKAIINDSLKGIDEALEVISDVENFEDKADKIPEKVTMEDEEAIKDADEAYKALSDYEKSLADKDSKTALDNALKIITDVKSFEAEAEKLPKKVTLNDEDAIKALKEAYDALTDYEKTLVSENAKKALDDAVTALYNLKVPATGDNSYIVLWGVLMMITTAVLFTVTRKKVTEK